MFRPVLALALSALQFSPLAWPLPTNGQFFEVLGSYVESLRSQTGIPGLSVAVITSDGVSWEAGFGRQDVERGIAARYDTPIPLDGLTEIFTAALVLRCAEEGRLSLGDRVGQYDPASADANATIAQILTHTDGVSGSATYAYRPGRLASLTGAIRQCSGDPTFRITLGALMDRVAMRDSVPGLDAVSAADPGTPVDRYATALDRLAIPYVVDRTGRATRSKYSVTTLSPSTGLISTAHDYARFDLAVKRGAIVRPDTWAAALRPPLSASGQPLPHGYGWFVQGYKGETIAWQFGVSDSASSSLVMMVPSRSITMVIAANSDGLVKPFPLPAGDLAVSPFGQLFLGTFVR